MLTLSNIKNNFQQYTSAIIKTPPKRLTVTTVALLAVGALAYGLKKRSSSSSGSGELFDITIRNIIRTRVPNPAQTKPVIRSLSSHKNYSLKEGLGTEKTPTLYLNEEGLPKVYGCNCDFSSKGNRQLIENKIIEHLVKAYPDANSEIPLAFLGSGGMLSEFLIVEKLRALGYKNFKLTFIDILYSDSPKEKRPEMQRAINSLKEYLARHTNSRIVFKSSLEEFVDEINSNKAPYNAIAIDYDASVLFPNIAPQDLNAEMYKAFFQGAQHFISFVDNAVSLNCRAFLQLNHRSAALIALHLTERTGSKRHEHIHFPLDEALRERDMAEREK